MLLTLDEIENVLRKTLPYVPEKDIHYTAETITNTIGEWREVDVSEIGARLSVQCRDICPLGEAYEKGLNIRAFIAKT